MGRMRSPPHFGSKVEHLTRDELLRRALALWSKLEKDMRRYAAASRNVRRSPISSASPFLGGVGWRVSRLENSVEGSRDGGVCFDSARAEWEKNLDGPEEPLFCVRPRLCGLVGSTKDRKYREFHSERALWDSIGAVTPSSSLCVERNLGNNPPRPDKTTRPRRRHKRSLSVFYVDREHRRRCADSLPVRRRRTAPPKSAQGARRR